MGKMRKFTRRVSGKSIAVYVYSDPDAVESILVGPDHIIVIANRELTEEEANSRIDGFFDIKPKCSICGRRHYYYRMGIGLDGLINTVCGRCDPSVKFAVAYFEAIDRLLA